MLSRLHSLLFFATTLIVTLQSQSGIAVQISNAKGRPDTKFFEPSRTRPGGYVKLQAWPFYDPRSRLNFGEVVEIKRGGTDKLVSLLRSGWREPEWEFVRVGGLEGIFNITNYNPCTPGEECGVTRRQGGVGAFFRIDYTPLGNDPEGNNVHWVQRVIDNYDGVERDEIDLKYSRTPYYDEEDDDVAGPDYLIDVPYYPTVPNRNLYFYAETYLVEEVRKPGSQRKTVNIRDEFGGVGNLNQ